jgi:hypothetical protein
MYILDSEKFRNIKYFEQRMKLLSISKNLFEIDKTCYFYKEITDENLKLLNYQYNITQKLNKNLINLSLINTIQTLIYLNENILADEMKKLFNITDKKFYWLKLKGIINIYKKVSYL